MNRATVVGWIVQAATVALAFIVGRRRPPNRALAWWIAAVLAEDVVRRLLWEPLTVPGPHSGALRVLFHLDQALYLIEPVGLAMVGWRVFGLRRLWIPLVAGAVVLACLVLGYPAPFRGATLGRAYAFVHAASCAAVVLGFVAWSRRRLPMRPEIAATLFAGAISVVLFQGPYSWALPAPWDDWSMADAIYLMLWGGLAAIHAVVLVTGKWLEPSPKRNDMMH